MNTEIVQSVGGLSARRARIATTVCGMDGAHVLRQAATVWECTATASADVWPGARVSDLVGTKSLLCLEALAALRADVVTTLLTTPVYDLQSTVA